MIGVEERIVVKWGWKCVCGGVAIHSADLRMVEHLCFLSFKISFPSINSEPNTGSAAI